MISLGGCGFIGSHAVLHLLNKYPNLTVVVYDKMDICSSSHNLDAVKPADKDRCIVVIVSTRTANK